MFNFGSITNMFSDNGFIGRNLHKAENLISGDHSLFKTLNKDIQNLEDMVISHCSWNATPGSFEDKVINESRNHPVMVGYTHGYSRPSTLKNAHPKKSGWGQVNVNTDKYPELANKQGVHNGLANTYIPFVNGEPFNGTSNEGKNIAKNLTVQNMDSETLTRWMDKI